MALRDRSSGQQGGPALGAVSEELNFWFLSSTILYCDDPIVVSFGARDYRRNMPMHPAAGNDRQ